MIGFCQTVPVNDSAGPRRDGADPNGFISMLAFLRPSAERSVLAPNENRQKGDRKSLFIARSTQHDMSRRGSLLRLRARA
jgi:hypothetical protein